MANSITTRYGRWANRVLAVATTGLFFTSILGLILIRAELNQLQRQNACLENTMRQTYRPFGKVNYSPDPDNQQIYLNYSVGPKTGKYTMWSQPYLHNVGKGVLSYIGSISYISTERVHFRRAFLDGQITEVYYDGMPSSARRSPFQINSYVPVTAKWENLDFEPKYYVSFIFLYEDQDGVFYDTERLDVFEFGEEAQMLEKGFVPDLKTTYGHETYHCYSGEERLTLIDKIAIGNESFANEIKTGY